MNIPYTYWKTDDGWFVGYWTDYPDHWTQGRDLAELEAMLRDVRDLINDGAFNDSPKSIGVMELA